MIMDNGRPSLLIVGQELSVPEALSKALLDCMGREKISGRPASVQFHLAKFVKRK